MKIGEFQISKLQIIVVAVLLIGLAAGLYLVQRTQIFKPRAAAEDRLLEVFEITDVNGSPLPCQPKQGASPTTCTTSSLDVKIKLKPNGKTILEQEQ